MCFRAGNKIPADSGFLATTDPLRITLKQMCSLSGVLEKNVFIFFWGNLHNYNVVLCCITNTSVFDLEVTKRDSSD